MRTLDQLKPGEAAVVAGLIGDSAIHQRMQEMGVIDGADVEMVRVAPLGDPLEILVQGYHLSLRRKEAALVRLED